MTAFLAQAQAFLRTAGAAFAQGDHGPAYENARTAAELAAKHMLGKSGITSKAHNVAEPLVAAGHWPSGEPFKRLSKFLGDHTRGIYGFHDPVSAKEAERAIRMASEILARACGVQ